MRILIVMILFLLSGVTSQAQTVNGSTGTASFYHDKFEGRRTATGDIFDNDKYTAASNTLKLGSYVKVTNLSNDEVIYVRINDRMSPNNKRLIDLTSLSAKKLRFHNKGLTRVRVEVVSEDEGRNAIFAQNNVGKPTAPVTTGSRNNQL